MAVDLLYEDGAADAVEAALWVEKSAALKLHALALTPSQRDAILRVMVDKEMPSVDMSI